MSLSHNHPFRIILLLLIFASSSPSAHAADCSDLPLALERASKIRGLRILKEVGCKSLPKAEYQKLMKEIYTEDTGAFEQKLTEKVFKMTAFIPEDYSYAACYLKESSTSVGAFYHPKNETVIIPSFDTVSFDTLVHEATHVLQDQHFDLLKLAKKANIHSDSALAFAALVEGDAESVQQRYVRKASKSDDEKRQLSETSKFELITELEPSVCELPSALLFQLEFPYSWGKRYIDILRGRFSISPDEKFAKLPSSTTSILYPKYKRKSIYGRAPLEFNFEEKINSLLPAKVALAKESYSDTFGEYTFRCILRQYLGSKIAVHAAKGWVYDTVRLSPLEQSPDKSLLSLGTAWETEEDAIEFKNAYFKVFEARNQIKLNTKADAVVFSTKNYPFVYIRRDKKVVGIFVSDAELLNHFRPEL